jgi:hypothetical protein
VCVAQSLEEVFLKIAYESEQIDLTKSGTKTGAA